MPSSSSLYRRLAAHAEAAANHLYSDPTAALAAAQAGLAEARRVADSREVARFLTLLAHASLLGSNANGECVGWLHEAMTVYKTLEEERETAHVAHLLGRALHRCGRYREAATALGRARDFYRTLSDRFAQAEVLESLAALHADLEDPVRALEHLHEAARTLGPDASPDMRGAIALNIGVLHAEMGSYNDALTEFSLAEQLSATAGNDAQRGRALADIAGVYLKSRAPDRAMEAALHALALFELLAMPRDTARLLATIGSIMERKGDYLAAIEYQMRALERLEEVGDNEGYLTALLNIGALYSHTNNPERGLHMLEEALELAHRLRSPGIEYQLHEAMALVHEALGDTASALNHYRVYATLREQAMGTEKQRIIATMQVRFEVERAEQERELYRLKSERLTLENEQQARDLKAMALVMVERSRLLDEVRNELTEIAAGSSVEETELRRLLQALEERAQSGEDWERLKDHLNQTHHDFMHTLAARYPDLTPVELRICALTRTGLATKEIADLLHRAVRNIENHRYRLRKKFGLGSEINFTTYIASI